MPDRINKLFSFKNNPILTLSVYFLILYAVLGVFKGVTFFSLTHPIVGLVLIIISGFTSVQILQLLLKRNFDFWENLSVAMLSILVLNPLLLIIEHQILGRIYGWLPILNIALITLLLAVLLVVQKKSEIGLLFTKISRKILISPFFFASSFLLITIVSIFSAYEFLPDKDPYTWILRYQNHFDADQLPGIGARSLFPSITYILTTILGLDIFNFFKYILPFFYLLTIFPAWLVARNYASKTEQLIVLAMLFISPNVIIYSQTAMPQAPFIILAYFFIFFLFYSYKKNDDFFYYAAGALALLSFLYHETAIFLLFPWIAISIISERNKLIRTKRDIFFISLIAVLAIQSSLKPLANFTSFWFGKLIDILLHPQINFLYPYAYQNVDGNEMGWQSLTGVAKFYMYYAGPLTLSILAIFAFLFFFQKKHKDRFMKIFSNKSILVLFFVFLEFFLISEIFPRFPGIAFLPDRAWVFTAIFSSVFALALLESVNFHKNKFLILFVVFLMITNIGGALYINYLKKNLLSSAEIKSYEWIERNIPQNSIVLSSNSPRILQVYSKKDSASIDGDFFQGNAVDNLQSFFISQIALANYDPKVFSIYTNEIKKEIVLGNEDYLNARSADKRKKITEKLSKKIEGMSENLISEILNAEPLPNKTKKVYFYYSPPNVNSPYYDRPYQENKYLTVDQIDTLSNEFKSLYADKENNIYIWEIL